MTVHAAMILQNDMKTIYLLVTILLIAFAGGCGKQNSEQNSEEGSEELAEPSSTSLKEPSSTPVDIAKIKVKSNLVYLLNSDKPFTGVIKMSDQGITFALIEFKEGKAFKLQGFNLGGKPVATIEYAINKDSAVVDLQYIIETAKDWRNAPGDIFDAFEPLLSHALKVVGWHKNGEKSYQQIVDMNGNGTLTEWHDNGQIRSKVELVKREYHGTVFYYDENGVKKQVSQYENGELIKEIDLP